MTLRTIIAEGATPPHGHYSHAAVQARYCLEQIAIILGAAGSSLRHVVKLNVHIADLSDWPEVNAVCAAMFGDHRPARIVAPCSGGLRLGSCIEMDVIAACAMPTAMSEK